MNTKYWINRVLDIAYRDESRMFYVGLSSTLTVNNDTYTFVEPSREMSYARVRLTGFTQPVNGAINNMDDIVFPISSGDWWNGEGRATYWLLFDGPDQNANLLSCGLLDTPHSVERNTEMVIPAGSLSVALVDYVTEP